MYNSDRNPGGSKRKGRNASNRYFAELLAERQRSRRRDALFLKRVMELEKLWRIGHETNTAIWTASQTKKP